MATRNSMGLRNFLLAEGSEARAFSGGVIELRSGAQPTSPNDAATGTLLGTITLAGGAHTDEVQAIGTVELTGGAAGSMSSITVNSIEILGATVNFLTDLPTTADLIVAQINRYQTKTGVEYTATSDGTATPLITIKPILGVGALANGWVVASTVATITKTDANMTGGVTAVNGLTFEAVSGGVLAKNSTEAWSGVWLASGTVGHFRMKGAIADAGAASQVLIRKDGNVTGTGFGGDVEITNTAVAIGAPFTVTTFNITATEA